MARTEPELLTVPEAAALLRIGRTTAYRLARQGELPCKRIARKVFIPRTELER